MTTQQNKNYKKIEKESGKQAANVYWREVKQKERSEQLDKDYPLDKPVMDRGQISLQTGGAFINKKKKKEGPYS